MHFGFRPDFCEVADPESKGFVEGLCRYAQEDLVIPAVTWASETEANEAGAAWCSVNPKSVSCCHPCRRWTYDRPTRLTHRLRLPLELYLTGRSRDVSWSHDRCAPELGFAATRARIEPGRTGPLLISPAQAPLKPKEGGCSNADES